MRHPQAVWPDSDAAAFASIQATGDYLTVVGEALAGRLGSCPSLLDIGAGTGALGARLVAPRGWHLCVEPSGWMAKRLATDPPAHLRRTVITCRWDKLGNQALEADTVLCANIPGVVDGAASLWSAVRHRARRRIIWVAPAQAGPRGWCLAGFLPADLHRADTRPGVELTCAALAGVAPTPAITMVDWTWRHRFASRRDAVAWLRHRIPEADDPQRLASLEAHCARHLRPVPGGVPAEAPKRSAILVWETA